MRNAFAEAVTNLAEKEISCSDLRKTYPNYFISKNKIDLDPSTDIQYIFDQLKILPQQYNL